jgi:tetratricopeptide (TPR) repeat protein
MILLTGFAVTRAAEPPATPPVTNALAQAATAFNRGLNLMAGRNWAGAIEAFAQAAAIRPDFFEAYSQAGIALAQWAGETGDAKLRLARLQAAADMFGKAAGMRPEDKATRSQWAATLEQLGDLPLDPGVRLACYRGAVEQYKRAVAIAPGEWKSYNQWGLILSTKLSPFTGTETSRRQLFREAADLFSKAVSRAKFSSDLAALYLNWASALVEVARLEPDRDTRFRLLGQTIDKFESAARAQPNAAPIYAAWGSALVDQWRLSNQRNDLRDAVDKFQSSLNLNKSDPAVLYNLAVAYALLDSRLTAVQQLRDCFDNDPNNYFRRQAAHDPDLDNLRTDPTFQQLVQGDQAPRLDEPPRLRSR